MLTVFDSRQTRVEIFGRKRRLEEIICPPVTLFAYSIAKLDRDYGPADLELVRQAGFGAVVFTTLGAASRARRTRRLLVLRLWANCARGVPAAEVAA
jgi:hypothetical protein